MNRDKKTLYIISALFLSAILLVLLIPSAMWQRVALAVIAIASCFSVLLLIKKRSILKLEKNQIAWLLPIIGLVAILVYFLIGFWVGFSKHPLPISVWWRFILPFAVTIFFSEITRHVLLAQKNKIVNAMAFVAIVLLDAVMLRESAVFATHSTFMDFVGTVLFPAISTNVLYHSVSAKYGALPVMIYKFLMASYGFVVPLRPQIPDAMLAFIQLVLPLAIFSFIQMLYERRKVVVSQKNTYAKVATMAASTVLMVLFVMLISCRFQYGMLVIATESMTGTIDKGDAIVYKAYDGDKIEEGSVLVFEKNGVTVIHRVIDVQNVDGQLRFYTKGDANENVDDGFVTVNEIVGTTDLTIKFIGYPTLWLRDILK